MQLGLNQMGHSKALTRLTQKTFWQEEWISPHNYKETPQSQLTDRPNQFFSIETNGEEEVVLAFLQTTRRHFPKHPYLRVGSSPYFRLYGTSSRYQRDPSGIPHQTNLGRPESPDEKMFYFDRFAPFGRPEGGFSRGLFGVHSPIRMLNRHRMSDFETGLWLAADGPQSHLVEEYAALTMGAFLRGYSWFIADEISLRSDDYARLSEEIFSRKADLTA